MTAEPHRSEIPSLRELRNRRERAVDWITYTSWTAIGTAVLSLAILVTLLVGDRPPSSRQEIALAVSLASALVVQIFVGWDLGQRRGQWNSWVLMTLYGLTLVIGVLRDGNFGNIVMRVLVGAVYVRGFMATVEYPELTAAIDKVALAESAASAQPPADVSQR